MRVNVIIGQSMLVGRAVAYIQERLAETATPCSRALLDEAAMRYNLSPVEASALERVFFPEKKPS